MHPPAFEHARSLQTVPGVWRLVGGLAAALFVMTLLGCEASTSAGRQSPFVDASTLPDVSGAERDSALAALDRMQRTAFDSSFTRLSRYAFTRTLRTEQLTPSGAVAALRTLTLRAHPDSGTTLVAADSIGAFQDGLFDRFASASDPAALPGALAGYVLEDKPAYLAARTREAFSYRLHPDTLDGAPVRVVTVDARPTGEGADQSIRRAVLTMTRDAHELVALSMVRAERSLLFREDSHFVVRLRRTPDGVWLPHLTRFHAHVGIPFRDAQQFRSVSTYILSDPR